MKCLVTGGAGFIGSHVVAELLIQGHSVAIIDNLSSGQQSNIPKGAVFIKGSILEKGILSKAMKEADWVFHLAAFVSVPQSMKEPEKCLEINTLGTIAILDEAVKNKVKKIVFSSSSAIYGNTEIFPNKETHMPLPDSPYALSKLDGEFLLEMYLKQYGLEYAALRYFNVYGPRQDPNSPYSAVIPIFIKSALNLKTLNVYGDGTQTRDFVFAEDVAKANVIAAGKKTGTGGIFNIGTGTTISVNKLAALIKNKTKSKSAVVHKPSMPGDVKSSVADISKTRKILSWKPNTGFEEGIEKTIAYYKKTDK